MHIPLHWSYVPTCSMAVTTIIRVENTTDSKQQNCSRCLSCHADTTHFASLFNTELVTQHGFFKWEIKLCIVIFRVMAPWGLLEDFRRFIRTYCFYFWRISSWRNICSQLPAYTVSITYWRPQNQCHCIFKYSWSITVINSTTNQNSFNAFQHKSYAASQEILCVLWNRKVHCRV